MPGLSEEKNVRGRARLKIIENSIYMIASFLSQY